MLILSISPFICVKKSLNETFSPTDPEIAKKELLIEIL